MFCDIIAQSNLRRNQEKFQILMVFEGMIISWCLITTVLYSHPKQNIYYKNSSLYPPKSQIVSLETMRLYDRYPLHKFDEICSNFSVGRTYIYVSSNGDSTQKDKSKTKDALSGTASDKQSTNNENSEGNKDDRPNSKY